jgi:flagellar basal body-associated protein FliL
VFHGAKDLVVPLKLSEEMVTAVTNAGGKAKLTVYPEAGHDSWTETYNNQAVYDWLLEQRRETPAALPTADAQASFVEAAFVDLKLGKPEDKNTFAAQVYLTSSRERAAAIHERVSSKRQALTQAIVDWVNAQPTADLVGNAGRERTRAEAKKLAQQIVFGGSTDLAFDVAFDLYFVRHNGRLVLEAK